MNSLSENISFTKKLSFYFIALCVIPLLALLMLEAGLRLVHFGYDTRFLVPCETQGCNFFKNNPDFTSQFFSKHLVRAGFPVVVPKEKAPGTYRIFILGESAAAGFPISDFSFSRILEVMLNSEFPNTKFEVINTSIVAINSHVILRMAQELATYQPDMFILYIGNNEVVGPYGPGTVFAPFTNNLSIIRLTVFLKSTRIGQLMQWIIDSVGKSKSAKPIKWDGMAMFTGQQIHYDDPRMEKVYAFYEQNINNIIKVCRKSNASVVLSSVGSNIKDMAPFASTHAKPVNSEWSTVHDNAIRYQQEGNYPQAIEQFLLAVQLDHSYAETHFRLGRCYEAISQFDLAHQSYEKAMNMDALRFRADSRMNTIIRKIASERAKEIAFVDAAKNFENHSPHGSSGKEFFYEHVHMNFHGQYLLASGLWPHVKAQVSSQIPKEAEPTLSMESSAKLLGFTPLEECIAVKYLAESLLNRAPFTNVLNHKELMDDLKVQQDRLQDSFDDDKLKIFLEEYRKVLEQNPEDPWAHYHMGRILLLLNRPQEALKYLQFAVEYMPSLKNAKRLLDLAQTGKSPDPETLP